jgi:subtilisin-like proprotein convertase family protein
MKRRIAVACVAVTGTAIALIAASSAGAKVYSSGDIDQHIPQEGAIVSKIRVKNPGTISDLNVRVRVSHGYDADLTITVKPPHSDFRHLTREYGNDGNNFGTGAKSCKGNFTVFDDEALTPISAGVAPFAGPFQPYNSLLPADGTSRKGTWKLFVVDDNYGDGGTLHCWQVQVQT